MFVNLLYRDWSIRLIGVVALLVGVMSFDLLFGGRVEPETAIGEIVAACGFLGCSGGAALTLLGAHIHDRISVARPWGGQLPAD